MLFEELHGLWDLEVSSLPGHRINIDYDEVLCHLRLISFLQNFLPLFNKSLISIDEVLQISCLDINNLLMARSPCLLKSLIALSLIPDSIRIEIEASLLLSEGSRVCEAKVWRLFSITPLHGIVVILSVTSPERQVLVPVSEFMQAHSGRLDLTEFRGLAHLTRESIYPIRATSHDLELVHVSAVEQNDDP